MILEESLKINSAVKPLLGRFPKGKEHSSKGRPIVYGIPNCDTTKKAIALLKKHQVDFYFHDYKQLGITMQKLEGWCEKAGWEIILNKRSTTWRELDEAEQKKVINQPAAVKLMMKNNSIIKRPIIEFDKQIVVGFNEDEIKRAIK